MFFTFSQNNSGGYFDGPRYIIVEAEDREKALEIGEENGVDLYADYCPCCGERWSEWADGPYETPCIYGTPAKEQKDCFGGTFRIVFAKEINYDAIDVTSAVIDGLVVECAIK